MKNKTIFINDLFDQYPHFLEQQLGGRYLNYDSISPVIEKLPEEFVVKKSGSSTLGIPIPVITFGKGELKILAWSQMHGNESTTTKAVFDLLSAFVKFPDDPFLRVLRETLSFTIVPMLNPDGAKAYTRVNANGVDLNRDAHDRNEKESKLLRKIYEDFQPDFCFNLHDQRTIFSAGNAPVPATMSFLTPAMNEARDITSSRKTSMRVIAQINNRLQERIPGGVGRYSDAFNINCTGDTFQSLDIPTILFEAGHYPGDYEREETRKFVTFSLFAALEAIIGGNPNPGDDSDYFKIPENEKLFFDVILRNARVEGEVQDVALQYREELDEGRINFVPVVEKVGRALNFFGHTEINCKEKELKTLEGEMVCENVVASKLLLKNKILIINSAKN